MKQEMIDLYNEYTAGQMTRREFLERLSLFAGSTAAALALLPLIESSSANARMVAPDDPDVARDMIGKLDRDETIKNHVAAVQYLKTHPQSTGKVGRMGF